MRIVELSKFKEVMKKVTMRMSIAAGCLLGIPTFLFVMLGDFFAGILVGAIVFGFMFGLVYLIRTMTEAGVEKRRNKLNLVGDYIEVKFNREYGVLEFQENVIIFHNVTPGGMEQKRMEIPYTMEIMAGEILLRKHEQLVYKDIPQGHVTVKGEGYNSIWQFVFYDIDGALSRVMEIVNKEEVYE